MKLSWDEIQANAITFLKQYKDAHNEEAEGQGFVMDFLRVFGVEKPMETGSFEFKVPLMAGKTGYIDYLWKGQIAIEMKSRGKDLKAAFEQLQNYMQHLPEDEIPDLWMVCDFANIRLCRRSTNEIWNFKTKDLRKHIKRFADIAGYETERIREDQVEVNVKAAEKMAKLHDALKNHGYEGHDLEVYLVRLLFCLFADDTGIFPQDSFFHYIEQSRPDGSDLSERIDRLFQVLNMPEETRAKRTLISDELRQFRYINGGLFGDVLPMAEFDAKMRQTLIDCVNFDWSKISPAIFGAMFQGVMDKNQRRELGAHYTSEENILKLINPLFMDDLWKEFDRVKTDSTALEIFHEKIACLKFLDPACGCGNFLIITYRELRLLEIEILKMQSASRQKMLDISPLLKVSVEQFYGIEYEDFPCQIATVGMWLIDHQMNLRVSEHFGQYYVRLPLTQSATIVHGNALRIDWESVVPKEELSYILGNPPFVGQTYQTAEQKSDVADVLLAIKAPGVLDYVSAWYQKTVDIMKQIPSIQAAFVSTNSITQGEQANILWESLFKQDTVINFAYRTFKWSNEAKGKAAVHCVIIGFGLMPKQLKIIFGNREDGDEKIHADNINQYLINAPSVIIKNRNVPLYDIPLMAWGNKPTDGGYFILSDEERAAALVKEPSIDKYIKKYISGGDFINNKSRYCLWLTGANPTELKQSTFIQERIKAVQLFRSKSTAKTTRDYANSPTLFRQISQPKTGQYLAIPEVSSERRRYIPMAYYEHDVICSNTVQFIANATLYHFGILTSNVHMTWVRAVCGRLEMRYRYSKDIVYNNFPWPSVNNEQHSTIALLAQGVLDARAQFPDSSLAALYDPLTMPPELLKAHQILDRAVMKLYGFAKDATEPAIVAALMERYRELSI